MACISNTIIALVAVTFLTACQTTYYDRGSGPIHLKRKTVATLERYESFATPGSFAVTPDGGYPSFIFCSSGSCSGEVTEKAIRLCREYHDKACKIFAIGREIVWEGPITHYQSPDGTYNLVLAISLAPGTGKHVNYSGTAFESNNGKTLILIAEVLSVDCSGEANMASSKWHLSCANDIEYSGTFRRAERLLYEGSGAGTNGHDATLHILGKSELLSRIKTQKSRK